MKPHHVTITPTSVHLDGHQLTIHQTGPRIEQIDPQHPLSIVHLPVIAETVELHGDNHHPDEPTPIYDQVKNDLGKARFIATMIEPDGTEKILYRVPKIPGDTQ